MELKNLLSVVIAAMTALGAMLYAMGPQNPWVAISLWMAAVVSLVVTDFLAVMRLPRNLASLLMWCVLAIFLPRILLQHNWDNILETAVGILICLQIMLLFQEKDPRIYGWLAVMSLLQVVVAARYSQGILFGGVLAAYMLVGIFALSLLALYSQWEHHYARPGKGEKQEPAAGRWPLAAVKAKFSSASMGTGRSGVVGELFGRLALVGVGALLLAVVIFYTVPRRQIAAWRGDRPKTVSTVGFNDEITLGGLGDTIESQQEVMQLKLLDPVTRDVYPMRDEVYLRGSIVTCYSQGHWRRLPTNTGSTSPSWPESLLPDRGGTGKQRGEATFRIGPPVAQSVVMEPYLERNDLFYIWPLVEPVSERFLYNSLTGQLSRKPNFSGEPRGGNFKFEVTTSGLVDGHQAPLIPANHLVDVSPNSLYLQMPEDRLPRTTALAARWLRESGLPKHKHYEVARFLERQFTDSGMFHYSLQGVDRDTSIDAVEDFVSNHPRGHCEYFATALTMMLRSQGIPSRVVLGYRCDEWHEDEQYYQVRQLHAHAWVDAFLAQDQVPKSLRRSKPARWENGGWLRLDATPAADLGTQAAQSTTWGTWQARWHGWQRYWDKYIVDMDRNKQRESVYEPISRATRNLGSKLLNPRWWRDVIVGLWASLAEMLRRGIMGWLLGVVVLAAVLLLPAVGCWWLLGRVRRFWRRLSAAGRKRRAGVRSSVEFYRRFEQIVARLGLQRGMGQTPREFALAAGVRLAEVSGRGELLQRAMQVADAFYSVRFGRQVLDAATAQSVQKALEELTAGSQPPLKPEA